MQKSLVSIFLLLLSGQIFAQKATISGRITDTLNRPVNGVNVFVDNQLVATSDSTGHYKLVTTGNREIMLLFALVSLRTDKRTLVVKPNDNVTINVVMHSDTRFLHNVNIESKRARAEFIQRYDPRKFESIPTTTGDISSILNIIGAHTGNELTNQYVVRGGNFDENLVYLNDFEIYRPQLISQAQQEGLSIINPDLVSSLSFSAGGFPAEYGDKLSSVLDVRYRKPTTFAATASASLLGGNVHIEGASKRTDGIKNPRFTYLLGARYKTTQYLLGTLDTKGDYKPAFSDIQGYATYRINEKWDLGFFAYGSTNTYRLIPQSRITSFGTVSTVLQLQMYFDGQELDKFNTYMGGINLTYKPRENMLLKWYCQSFLSDESQTYDITAQYFIGEVETDQSKKGYGQIKYYLGVGTVQNYARDYLSILANGLGHKGEWQLHKHQLKWGVKYQNEQINDDLKQWNYLDSAGYALPYGDTFIRTNNYLRNQLNVNSNRYDAYLQDIWAPGGDTSHFIVNYGIRLGYWDFNKQFMVSPRAQLSYIPFWQVNRDWVFKASVGMYQQPPFFRELIDQHGVLHNNVLAQQAIHYVIGGDYNFKIWKRPFKFVTELYYKDLRRINPYDIDNVRITYYANNNGVGYATGADLRLHGELVKDVESWVSLGILNTREYISGLTYTTDGATKNVGWVRRPTDQLINFSMFFQDYIRNRKDIKVHLSFIAASGLPASAPFSPADRSAFTYPSYTRVDIGFSGQLMDSKKHPDRNISKHLKSLWAAIEVFNLFGVQNVISYTWVKDYYNHQFAVPNYLTGRLLNLRITAKFN